MCRTERGEETRSNEYFNYARARIRGPAHGVDIERVKVQRGVKERIAMPRCNRLPS